MKMNLSKCIVLLFLSLTLSGLVFAESKEKGTEVKKSTPPLGSSFYRHLAFDVNMDIRELVKFERKGFGRTEILSLVFISSASGKPIKKLGKRRLKEKVSLKKLATEAGLDYETLYKMVRVMKKGIEAKGDKNLPPPVYAKPKKEKSKKDNKKKKQKKKKGKNEKEEPPLEATEMKNEKKAIQEEVAQ